MFTVKKFILGLLGVVLVTCVVLLIPSLFIIEHSQNFEGQATPDNQAFTIFKFSEASNLKPKPKASQVEVTSEVSNRLVAANNKLGYKLFSEIFKQQPNQNIFISPSNVAISLAMVYNGASGKTQRAIAQTLELQGISLEKVNQALAALKASLINSDPEVQLAIANLLWSSKDISFNLEFLQRVRKAYTAQIETVDFSNPSVSSEINEWARQNTNGMIDEIVDAIDPNSALLLLNAIYFNGKWKIPFPKEATQTSSFYLLNGKQKQHDMILANKITIPTTKTSCFKR